MSPDSTRNGDKQIRRDTEQGVAIIGMACLFPGAPDLTTYWRNILNKVDAVTDPPPGAWDPADEYNTERGSDDQIYCRKGGFLAPFTTFNPLDYGIMPVGLDGGEPDQWLALKVAYDALQDAGYLERLRANADERQRAAVIFGKGTYLNRGNLNMVQHSLVVDQTIRTLRTLHPEYTQAQLAQIRADLTAQLPAFNAESAPGLVPNITAGRVANRLDLMGPAYTVDGACASALLALEHAVNELTSGRSDLVLAGGVHVSTPAPILALFSRLGALSHQEMIRPFDERADGTILSEGIGIVVLKRAADAYRDGDRVYAMIRGVGSSSDGRGLSVLTPRLEGEVLALQRAYAMAGAEPESVGLIEAHGTGTVVGDQTEIRALRTVFGERGDKLPTCALGSVKSMIGHTMPAAGIAGVIKVALALYHKVLPPTIHVDRPDPRLELEQSPFYLNTETRPWIHGNATPRRAGVNAFGFGGVNAHVLLEEAQAAPAAEGKVSTPDVNLSAWESEVVILGGATRADLIGKAQSVLAYCAANPDVALLDVAYTLTTAAGNQPCRLALVAESVADLCAKVEQAIARLEKPTTRQIKDVRGIYFFEKTLYQAGGKIAFLFPGEGAQYPNMLADLCIHFPEVRACFDRIDRLFADHPRGFRPSDFIFPRPSFAAQESPLENQLWQIDGAVEAVLTANMAMFALLERLGIPADACVGHSTGEYSALLSAGAIQVSDDEFVTRYLMELNRRYNEVVDETEVPRAVMVAMGTGLEQVEVILAEIGANEPEASDRAQVFVSMDNCPHQTVVLGDAASMQAVMAHAQAKGVICEVLPFDRGYHSPLFAPYNHLFEELYNSLPFTAPQTPIYSCVTAARFGDDVTQIRRLATENWVSRVRFRETLQTMYEDGFRIFVEVGPRGNLTSFTGDILRGQPHLAVAANIQHRSGISQVNHLLALLSSQHVPVDLAYLYQRRNPQRLALAKETGATETRVKEAGVKEAGRPAQTTTVRLATAWASMEPSPALVQQLQKSVGALPRGEPSQSGSRQQTSRQNGDYPSAHVAGGAKSSIVLRPLNDQTFGNSGSNHSQLDRKEHVNGESEGRSTMKQLMTHETNGTNGVNGTNGSNGTSGVAEHTLPSPTSHPAQDFTTVLNGSHTAWQPLVETQDERALVMQAHLQLMQRFLHTQETIMLHYLAANGLAGESLAGGRAPLPKAASQPPPLVHARPVSQSVAPAPTPVYMQPTQVQPVKQAAPEPKVAEPVVSAPPAAAPPEPTVLASTTQPVDIKAILLRLVSERTGYPQEMLDLKANLEADLGIDSIKRVEILGAFNRETKLLNPKDIDHVSTLKSLEAILNFFDKSSL